MGFKLEKNSASNVFIYNFKKRRVISFKQCSGEIQNVTIKILMSFKNYSNSNFANMDQITFSIVMKRDFFTNLLQKSLVRSAINGIKKFKDRITVMFACNMTSSFKLKPVIMRNSKILDR